MSRRDIIIVAVLINAGLLIVLFASALKSSPGSEFIAAPVSAIQETPDLPFKKEMAALAGDEVDQALNQFTQHASAAATPAVPPQLTVPLQQPALSTSFADDLKMIAQPEAASPPAMQNPSLQTLTIPITPLPKVAADFTEIKVKKGDVLEKIARHHHTTVAEIMKANKLTSSNLRIGQVLKIPNKAIKKAESSTVAYSVPSIANSNSEGDAKYYTVKKGDSPWTIAVKNQIKVETLLKLNNMSEEQARRLKPGDQLRIQ
jgi:peptidoglycan endopeptidase LytF